MNKLAIFVTLLVITATSNISAYTVGVDNQTHVNLTCIIHRRAGAPIPFAIDANSYQTRDTGPLCIYGVTIQSQYQGKTYAKDITISDLSNYSDADILGLFRGCYPLHIIVQYLPGEKLGIIFQRRGSIDYRTIVKEKKYTTPIVYKP